MKKEKVKIAFMLPYMVIGGVESVLLRTLEELSKDKNIELHLFFQLPVKEKYFLDWFKSHPDIKITVFYPLGYFFGFLGKFLIGFPLKNIRKIIYSLYKKYKRMRIRKSGIFDQLDVLIDYKNFNSLKEIRCGKNKKACWIHGGIDFFRTKINPDNIKEFDKIICISESFLRDFKSDYPEYKDKIMKIYNPVNFNDIREKSKKKPVFSGKYFMSVSRMSKDKDVGTIILGFNKFWQNENKPDVNLVLVGGGNKLKSFRKMASLLPAARQIIFTGAIPEPFGYMRGSLAHILSSTQEGLPTVLTEAAACETLNISSNCKSGPSEILMDGDAGILFPVGDYNRLADIMSDIYHNRIPRKDMIENGTKGLERFNCEKVAYEIRTMIDEL